MDDTDLRAELARVTKERDALLAERERTAPLVAAARRYVEALLAADAACEGGRATRDELVRLETAEMAARGALVRVVRNVGSQ